MANIRKAVITLTGHRGRWATIVIEGNSGVATIGNTTCAPIAFNWVGNRCLVYDWLGHYNPPTHNP